MQVIYSFDTADITPSIIEIEKALKTKFNQTGLLLNYLVALTVEIAKYVEIYSNQKASKHITTKADLNVNIKIAGNNVIWQIMENKSFAIASENNKIDNIIDRDLVKKLFLQLEKTSIYKEYIETDSRTNEADLEIMKYIFNEILIDDAEVELQLTEQFQNFDDDIEMLHIIVNQTLEKPKATQFTKLISADKSIYSKGLVETYYDKATVLMDYIKPKLKNWDSDRVAKLDMIGLHLGVIEMLYFETIPVKVTINEYIDIAKDYSTPQSGQFVNGILDSIHKDLLKDEKLHKIDFQKF